jgi:multisubunit Na+/H+ antiporter MnhG subunit
MRSLSVELKLVVAVLLVCVTAAMAAARIAGGIFERNVEDAALSTLQAAADAFAAQERSDVEKLASTLDALLANDRLRMAFVARDRERLLAAAAPLFVTMSSRDRITHWYFIEPGPAPAVFLRVHKPGLHGDVVERATLRIAAETRNLGAGKELGRTAFALRAVRPWLHEGKLLGYMELAEEIDHFLGAMKARTGDEYGLLVKKKFLDEKAWADVLGPRSNTWNDRPDVVVVDTTTFTEGIIDFGGDVEAIPDEGLALDEVERGERPYVRGIFPVRDAAGRKVGALFVLHDFTRHHAAMRAGMLQTFLALLAVAVACAAAVSAIGHLLLFRRLGRLRRELEARAAEAGLPQGRVVQLESEDEIGRLEALFRRLLFPSRGRDEPPGDAPGSAPGGTGR